MYSQTDIQLFNAALGKLGEVANPVTAVDGTDTTKHGTLAGLIYRSTRNEELRANTWRFAVRRSLLVQNTVANNFTGYTYAYDAPSDCLRVVEVFEKGSEYYGPTYYQYEGDLIFCNSYPGAAGPYARYIVEPYLGGATLSVTTTNTSKTVTAGSTAGLLEGMGIAGTGIPAGATIKSVESATSFTISAAATGSATVTATLTMNWRDSCFADAVINRLAAKLVIPVTGNPLSETGKANMDTEYYRTIEVARQKNAIEVVDSVETDGQDFWTERW